MMKTTLNVTSLLFSHCCCCRCPQNIHHLPLLLHFHTTSPSHPSNDTHQEPTSKQTSFGAAAESDKMKRVYTMGEKKGIIKYKFSMTYHTVSLSLFSRASLLVLEHMLCFFISRNCCFLSLTSCFPCDGVYSQRSTSSAKTHW